MMLSFDPETLVSYEAPALDVSDQDPVDWDAWLTPEALRDKTDPSASQCSFIDLKFQETSLVLELISWAMRSPARRLHALPMILLFRRHYWLGLV